jgi:hypothetical protein
MVVLRSTDEAANDQYGGPSAKEEVQQHKSTPCGACSLVCRAASDQRKQREHARKRQDRSDALERFTLDYEK